MFFIRKYLKAPIALLVCLVMVLQLLPAPQPAQAGFWDIIKKIVTKVPVPPNITLTDKGRIKAESSWLELDVEVKQFGGENPFNKISLGGGAQPLIDIGTGQMIAGRCWETSDCDPSQNQVARVVAGALSNTEAYLDSVYATQLPDGIVGSGDLIDPAKVKQMLRTALGVGKNLDAYNLQRLRDGNQWRRVWAQYWLDLGSEILGAANPQVKGLSNEISKQKNKEKDSIEIDEKCDPSVVQTEILKAMATEPYLRPLTQLDDEKGIGSQNKDANIDNYAQKGKRECCLTGRPVIPEECELGIKRPGDDPCDAACAEERTPILRENCREKCAEEKLAYRQACTHYIRLQKAAADIAFLAKKIYNNTNPLDACFFLKNCKSNCSLRYGEIKYVITWLDIAQFLLPTAWLTVIKQIMGVLAALNQIKTAYEALTGLLTDGLTLVSNFFDTFKYLQTMFAALQNIGGTMSASIGVASVAASALKETGILPIPGNALQFGAVAGAATVLTADSKGVSAMQGMLKRFSDNLLNYSTAKNETNKLLLGMRQVLADTMEGNDKVKGAKRETELAFFFEPNNPARKDLDSIVGNLQTNFKSLASLLDSTIDPGNLPIGPISGLAEATNNDYWNTDVDPAVPVVKTIGFGQGNSGGITITGTAFADGVRLIKNKENFCSGIKIDPCTGNNCQVCLLQDDRIIPWSEIKCPASGILLGSTKRVMDLTEPAYVEGILREALGGKCPAWYSGQPRSEWDDCCNRVIKVLNDNKEELKQEKNDSYCLARLRDGNQWRRVWAQYWLELGTNILTAADSRVEALRKEIANKTAGLIEIKDDKVSKIQVAILGLADVDYSYLRPLAKLDDENGLGGQNKERDIDNYAKLGALSNTLTYLNSVYKPLRLQKAGFINACAPETVEEKSWLTNFKDIFTLSSTLQANLKLVDPIYIREMLIGEGSVLGCAHKAEKCKLNWQTKGWREYWETMARGLGSAYGGKDIQERHLEAIKFCVGVNSFLKPLALMDTDYEFGGEPKAGLEARDRGYYNKYDDPVELAFTESDPSTIQAAIINKLDNSGNKPFAFLAPIAALDDKGSRGAYDLPLIRPAVFAEIDKYGLKRADNKELFPVAATPDYAKLIANLDGDSTQYLKVVERTEPGYLKNLLDASLGCGCIFDSNAQDVSQEIFCDRNNNDRATCEQNKTFKYAVLDDSKAAWHYFWTRLGRIILQVDPTIDCQGVSDMKNVGTREYIRCQLVGEGGYEQRLVDNRTNGGGQSSEKLTETVGGKINEILEKITAFTYQRNYLESPDRHAPQATERERRARHFSSYDNQQEIEKKGEEGSDYWQSKFWCTDNCLIDPQGKFIGTYDQDILRYDWSNRANKVINSVEDLNTIVYGLSMGLSPQDPAVLASMAENAEKFAVAVEKGNLAMGDFRKERQRDCVQWNYFWGQEHYFKQYGDGDSHLCDCSCKERACLDWTNDSNEGHRWCDAGWPSCRGEVCFCCSNITKKNDNCNSQRISLENTLHPKCSPYIPNCTANDKAYIARLLDECVNRPCQAEKDRKAACLTEPNYCQNQKTILNDCLAKKTASQCQAEKDQKDVCLACTDEKNNLTYCEPNPCRQYDQEQANCDARLRQRSFYTAEEINGEKAANEAAQAEQNTLWNLFGVWQWYFGGTTAKPTKPDDPEYYKNHAGYKALSEIEGLILALQIVWQDDLTTIDAQERLARAIDIFSREECKNGYWVFDPLQRCTGRVVKINDKLNEILTVWRDIRRATLQTASGSEARPAKEYAASIISSKILAREISFRIQNLKYLFEGWPGGDPANSPIVMKQKIANDLSYLSSAQKAKLLDIISQFEPVYNDMKTKVIDTLDKAVGQYIPPTNNPTRSVICPIDIAEQGFLNRLACFEYCGGLPLDKCLDSQTEIRTREFEQLMQPLSAIENIEDAIFLLNDATLDIDKIASVQESVNNLQPKIEAQNVVSINTNLINDFNSKLAGAVKGIFNKYNPNKEGGIDTNPQSGKIQLFNSSNGGSATFKDFANSLSENPLSFLNDQFANIEEQFKTIRNRLKTAGDLLGQFYGGPRGSSYSSMANEVGGPKMDELNLKINGNQTLTGACSALGLILQGDIAKMDKTCSPKEDGGELNSQWLSQQLAGDLQKTCDIWLTLPDDMTGIVGIDQEIADLENLRNGVGPNKIKCPTWFCLNPISGTRGSNAMEVDPYCVEKCVCMPPDCKKWQPEQKTGYVCDFNERIIWNTADFGPGVSKNPAPAVCQGLGFVPDPLCTVAKTNARCQIMDDFLADSTCDLFDSCGPAELKKQADIKKWLDQKAANQCPKWLCLNERGFWAPLVSQAICVRDPYDPNCKEDIYCKQIRNGGPFSGNVDTYINEGKDVPGDGFYYRNRVIWDTTTNPGAAKQIWSGTKEINAKCAEAQQGLQKLGFGPLDPPPPPAPCSPLQLVASFCGDKNTCVKMKQACADWAAQKRNSDATADNPLMEWPPTKLPHGTTVGDTGFTQGYQSAQNECIRTQETITALKQVREEIAKTTAANGQFAPDKLAQLNTDCNELKRQQELKKECDSYGLTKKALANSCGSDSACKSKRDQMNQLCAAGSGQGWSSREDYCNADKLKNLLVKADDSDATKIAKQNGLQKVHGRCAQTLDIRTPLGEIMKALSILMGIQSGTAAHGGMVTSIQGARVFYENAGKFIKMIEGLKDSMGKAYDDTMANSAVGGGFKITPFKCVAMPAASTGEGKRTTGPEGGPVCPGIDNFYAQIQADFAAVRQEAKIVEGAMYKASAVNLGSDQAVDIALPWNEEGYIHLYDKYSKTYPSLQPLSDRAAEIRQSAQFVWAMATAINYANSRCTCGMSYCKLPFCISGLPLTLEPLKQPYCALVWMLRTPMVDISNHLVDSMNKKLDKVK